MLFNKNSIHFISSPFFPLENTTSLPLVLLSWAQGKARAPPGCALGREGLVTAVEFPAAS